MMDDLGCCAHLIVRWTTEEVDGWWECKYCHSRFAPVALCLARIATAERLLAGAVNERLDLISKGSAESKRAETAERDKDFFQRGRDFAHKENADLRKKVSALERVAEAAQVETLRSDVRVRQELLDALSALQAEAPPTRAEAVEDARAEIERKAKIGAVDELPCSANCASGKHAKTCPYSIRKRDATKSK